MQKQIITMNKIFLLFTFFLSALSLNAQRASERSLLKDLGLDDRGNARSKYLNLGYAFQSIENRETDFLSLKSDYALSLTAGNTFYLNKEPLFNCLLFGIDWTWLDLNFADYSKSFREKNGIEESSFLQLEAGMHAGPSITIDAGNELAFYAYFRYAPSYSGFYNEKFKPYAYNYASFFVTGIGASYRMGGLGIERRWGKADYEFKTEGAVGSIGKSNFNLKTGAIRIYISYRF